MKKKSVNLITAVGVLVVLSGAYVGVKAYVAKQEAADTESAEEENPEIISIASADVKSIKFVIDKKEVTFEKEGDSWVKSDETDFPVDQDKIDTLVSSMNSIKAERTLENVEDASEYELDQPENTITVTTEDGETTVIQLGMENDSTSQEYIDLNEDSSTVYVVSNSTFSSFEGTLYDFAKSGVFPTVDSSTVSKISVEGKDSSYVVEKDENNFWNITGDGETEKADSAKASALSSMAYSSYVNYNCAEDEFSQYGLDKPYAEIIVDYQKEVEKESTDDENEAENGDEEVSEASENENQGDETADSETDGSESLDEDVDSETDGNESSDEDVDSETDGSESSDENVDVADTEDSEVVENENTDETADDNVEAEDTDVTEADDAAEVEAADTESTESSGESEAETEMVDRELVIQVGDQSSDGGRYVRVNDSNEIYTISEDSLDTFLGKTNADFWDLTVSYLSVNNLDTLDVNYGEKDYIVNVSRETSEDENVETSDNETEDEDTTDDTSSDVADGNDVEGNAADDNASSGDLTDEDTENTDDSSSTASTTSSTSVTLSYTLNGKDLDSTTFTTFYNKLINMTAQKRLTDEFKSNADPEMTVKFTDIDYDCIMIMYVQYI